MSIPETQMHLTLEAAGHRWDVIRVTAGVGAVVMDALGDACGSVAGDERNLRFFIAPGEGGQLAMPGVTVVGRCEFVLIPADRVTAPPGPHWVRLAEQRLTPTHRLQAALRKVLS